MGNKEKWFEDKQQAFGKLYQDVGRNNVKIYDVGEYQSKATISIHPNALLDKCSHIEVAVSGEAPTGKDWMVIAPYRVDHNSGKKVYDVDPVLCVFDNDTGSASESGVVAYHQKFDQRTSEISGYEHGTLEQTVSDLRTNLTTGLQPLASGSQPVLNALGFMHKKYRSSFGGGEGEKSNQATRPASGIALC